MLHRSLSCSWRSGPARYTERIGAADAFERKDDPVIIVSLYPLPRRLLPNLQLLSRSILSELQLPLLVERAIFLPLKRVNAVFIPQGVMIVS